MFNFASENLIGTRKTQEDYCENLSLNDGNDFLMVLADGMGGHNAGDVASKLAVKTFISSFINFDKSMQLGYRLNGSLYSCNTKVSQSIAENKSQEGMGCTLVAAYISDFYLSWISVGDSLLYILRGKKLIKLNADHSMMPVLEKAYQNGSLTKEEFNKHPQRNVLRSAVIGEEIELIDINDRNFKLKNNDVILLASDGLLTLSELDIKNIISQNKTLGAERIASALINEVRNKDKRNQDNTTVQILITDRKSNNLLKLVAGILALVFLIFGVLNFKNGNLVNSLQSSVNYIYQKLTPNDEIKNDGAVKLKKDKTETSIEDKADPLKKDETENPEVENDDINEGDEAQPNNGFKNQQQSIRNEKMNEGEAAKSSDSNEKIIEENPSNKKSDLPSDININENSLDNNSALEPPKENPNSEDMEAKIKKQPMQGQKKSEDGIKINSDSNKLNKNEKPNVPSSKATEAKEM